MKYLLRSLYLVFLTGWVLVAMPGHAAPAGKPLPPALKDWETWATWNDEHQDCPAPYSDAKTHFCFWPSRMAIAVEPTGGHFDLAVTVFHQTWVPLPGDGATWPLEVTANGIRIAVVEHENKPAIQLAAGTYRLEGKFLWKEMPQRLALPRQIGILALSLEGKPVEAPTWDADGLLWLKREGALEAAEHDFLEIKAYALLEDGVPLKLETQVDLSVSGKSREETLGNLLPEGWKLMSVDANLPVAVDASGRLKVQVRAGRWTIQLSAFRLDDAKEIRYAADAKPAVKEQLVGFDAKPELRTLEILGAQPIDVSQTSFPEAWRSLPVYRWDTATPFRLEERMRGMGAQKPPGLAIERNLWLDEGGRRLTFQDLITGERQQIWRLDAAPGQALGAVRSGGEGQLITRNAKTGAPGVEIRSRQIALEGVGRLERTRELSATGWSVDADSLNVSLNLPPGWRLFALFGADWTEGDWLTSWTLLDVFLLLLFVLAVFRLWGFRGALLALLAFGLSYQESGAPRYVWLALLIPIALLRVVPQGRARQLVGAWKWITVGMLTYILVPFLAAQIQQALYPQLENVQSYEAVTRIPLGTIRRYPPDFSAKEGAMARTERPVPGGIDGIKKKLDRIIIPKLDFRETTVREVVEFLKQKSVELDTQERDPARRGLSFVLRLEDGANTGVATPRDMHVGVIPGLEAIPGIDAARPASTAVQPMVSPGDARITVNLTNIPLSVALTYVTQLANVKYKVEPYGIVIVPIGTPTDVLISREFKVRPGFIGPRSAAVGADGLNPSALADASRGGSPNVSRLDAKEFLIAQGIPFPPGATATYLTDSSRLVVRNTQENLDLMETLVNADEGGLPIASLAYDPKARIQTGPGVPGWSWHTVRFGWKGPVLASQKVRPVLIPLALERVLSILRVLLLVALPAVLLDAWRLGGPLFRRRPKAGALVLFALFAGAAAASARAQEIPSAQMLETLRTRLLEPSSAFPNAADIATVALSLNDRRITMDAEIHVAARTAVPIPGKLPAWSPLSVVVDGKPEAALRREDGFLWVVLSEGIHAVHVEGMLENVTDWQWTFRLKPRRVTIDAPGWDVSGVRPDGVPEAQVFLARKAQATPGETKYELQNLQPLVQVKRVLELGLVWEIKTTVTRMSPLGKAIDLRLPLVPGEKVVSPDALVKDGFIEVRLGAQVSSADWSSELPFATNLKLATRAGDAWVEEWRLVASRLWNVALAGIVPIFEAEQPELVPMWHPWPGESVELVVSRPEAIAGATVTINKVLHEVTLGTRQRLAKLELSILCSLGEDFSVTLPAAAEVTVLSVDGKALPARKEGANLIIPLRAGAQPVSIAWKIDEPLRSYTKAGDVRLPVESANIETTLELPGDRWVLWTHGPQRGPAVRLWGILVGSLLAGFLLGRLAYSPLRSWEWMLLVIGLTQVPLPAALAVAGWMFLLAWRGRPSFQQRGWLAYDLLQVLLMGLTLVVIGVLVYAVSEGLLGTPEMFISGNDSSRDSLRWYQAQSQSLLPTPGCLSISIWWFRGLMLLWALWLAGALLRWLGWAWNNFKSGGFFRARHPKTPPPLPAALKKDEGASRPTNHPFVSP